MKNESKVWVSIFLERFFRAQIFPPLGDKLFSCLQFSKNVNFDSCSKINGWISRISIQLQFPQNAVETHFWSISFSAAFHHGLLFHYRFCLNFVPIQVLRVLPWGIFSSDFSKTVSPCLLAAGLTNIGTFINLFSLKKDITTTHKLT